MLSSMRRVGPATALAVAARILTRMRCRCAGPATALAVLGRRFARDQMSCKCWVGAPRMLIPVGCVGPVTALAVLGRRCVGNQMQMPRNHLQLALERLGCGEARHG